LKLGDPNYRGLSKMENDPLITQRVRDTARTVMCKEQAAAMGHCAKEAVMSNEMTVKLAAKSPLPFMNRGF